MSENTPALPEIKTRYAPDEFMSRWNDQDETYQGSHVRLWEIKYIDGIGVIEKKLTDPLTAEQAAQRGFPFEAVLDQLLTDTLVDNDRLKAENAEKDRAAAAKDEAHAAEIAAKDANLQTLLGQVEALKAEADAMQAALTEAQKEASAGFFTKLANLFTK